MASNITLNAGSGGSTLATEQNGSAEHYQKIKITDGTATAFTNSAAVTAGSALKVDNSGVVQPINDNGGSLTVDNAGTFATQASQAGTWNVTNVSGTVSLPTGAATSAKQPALGAAGTASADVITVQGITSMTALKVDGSGVTQPVSGTVTTTPPSNASTNVAQINAVTPLMGNGTTGTGSQRVTIASDNTAFAVNATLQTGSAVIGHVIADTGSTTAVTGTVAVTESGTWTVQPGNTANTTPWLTSNQPPSNGTQGWSFDYQSALAATKHQIKGSAGTFGGYIMLTNPNTAETYVQVFNKTSATVTVGTTAPDFVLRIPGLATASGTGVAANLELVNGVAMSTGITVAATTTATGSSAPVNAVTATFLFL